MIAKKTSKNQLTLPKRVADRFPNVDYFDVRVEDGKIALVPVRLDQAGVADRLEQVQARLARLGLSERDVKDAVASARKGRK